MTRQLYELEHPLYPHKELLEYFNKHKMQYRPYQGSYDDAYNNWYQLVRADHDISGAPKRPIYREISQILRLKSSGQEYLKYSETLYGQDHENNTIPFFHTYGQYSKPLFRTTYNYETKTAHTLPTGQIETIYFIKFDKNLIDQLCEAGPDDMDIEFLINVGSKQYGGRGFFTQKEFRDLPFEELGRIGSTGKDLFTQQVAPVPFNTKATEQKALGSTTVPPAADTKLWNEFLQFQKFKEAQSSTNIDTDKDSQQTLSNKTIKVKATGEK